MKENTLQSRSTIANRINTTQLMIGVGGLIIGSLVYIIDRPPEQTYFINNSKIPLSLYNAVPNIFGIVGNSLPDLLHVFSFILITAGFGVTINTMEGGGLSMYLDVGGDWAGGFGFDRELEVGELNPMYQFPDFIYIVMVIG